MERSIIHIILHFLVPFIVAKITWRELWRQPFIIMALTFVVDFDHLLAEPVFNPNRCSLGFHPLHSWPTIGIYLVSLFSPCLRIIAIGVLIHMVLDGTDCFWID